MFLFLKYLLKAPDKQVLRIAQITDPHLGIHMSPERLQDMCSTIASWNPDLVFITGIHF